MIIYFTGTGNSRYIAEHMASQLDDTVTDAAAMMKEGKYPSFDSEKPYVFVSPVYAWRMPRVFEKWIKKCSYNGNKKAYFAIDCGESIGAAANYVKSLAKKTKFEYMGTAQIVMPDNYLIMFASDGADDDKIIENAANYTTELCKLIRSESPFDKIKTTFTGHLCSDIVTPFFYTFYIRAKKFYATDACISCGKCAENCMLNNITINDGRPVWGKDCTHCMACICKCPTEAIEYGKNTQGRRRYTCDK